MNSDRDFERTAAEWLDAGSDATPPRVIDAVLLAVRTTPQERDFGIPWRTSFMNRALSAAAVIAVVAIAGIAAFYAFGRGPNVGSGPTPSPSTQQSQAPSASATPNPSAIDVTSWTTYQSDRYGFSIGHPSDWTEFPADHDWTLDADGPNWLSTGQEVFKAPGNTIRVSAWSIPVDRSAMPETTEAVEAWIVSYCNASINAPCDQIHARAVPLCVERRDCHPGLLVPFTDDVQAFFTGGIYGDTMVVVAVWWGESQPAVAPYGGARRLLEAFLSTMHVCEAGESFADRPASC
jgi:hypothetical protein